MYLCLFSSNNLFVLYIPPIDHNSILVLFVCKNSHFVVVFLRNRDNSLFSLLLLAFSRLFSSFYHLTDESTPSFTWLYFLCCILLQNAKECNRYYRHFIVGFYAIFFLVIKKRTKKKK